MKGYCARAIVSSVFGELVDSTAFMTLAFAGTMPASTMLKSILFYVAMKCAYEAIILPVNKLITAKVKEYESRD